MKTQSNGRETCRFFDRSRQLAVADYEMGILPVSSKAGNHSV
jgi:hypothetical protein